MPEFRAYRRCTCCEVSFRPIDQLYGDESKPQKMCRTCIEHRAKPDQKLKDHARIHLEKYRAIAEECAELKDRLDRTKRAIRPVSLRADARAAVLDEIYNIVQGRGRDREDEESANATLGEVYTVLNSWRYDERR